MTPAELIHERIVAEQLAQHAAEHLNELIEKWLAEPPPAEETKQ